MKCLKNSSVSVQDSDKSSWPLGFQVEDLFPAHPSCHLGEQNGSFWKSDSTVPSSGTGDREQQNTKLQSACCLIKSMHCVQCLWRYNSQNHSQSSRGSQQHFLQPLHFTHGEYKGPEKESILPEDTQHSTKY